jgi:intraflagellar transport protein 52
MRADREEGQPSVLFDVSKKGQGPKQGSKELLRKLKQEFKVVTNEDSLSAPVLKEMQLAIFFGPREKFSAEEFTALKEYMDGGGSVIILLGEGGESKYPTNVNYLLEEYGIMINNDAVVRTAFYKYHHPKECGINNGILCQDIFRLTSSGTRGKENTNNKTLNLEATKVVQTSVEDGTGPQLPFVYPYGATLSVQKPAGPVLSSGPISYPLNRPLAAACEVGKGRLFVMGSVRIFDDDYIDHESNSTLLNLVIKWCMRQNDLDLTGGSYPELEEYHYIPDTRTLAEDLKSCLQESEPLPRDFTQLFDSTLFGFDTSSIPEAVKLYADLAVKHEPLTLVPPQFETPMPKLQPAVFPPTLNEPPAPSLDLFDLDEHFASEKVRLAQLTNKCSDGDLEYYITEAGDVLGVTQKLGEEERSAKHVLTYIFNQLCNFKRLNFQDVREADFMGRPGM